MRNNNWLRGLIKGIEFRKGIGEKFERETIEGTGEEMVVIDIKTNKLYIVKEKYWVVGIAELGRKDNKLDFKILNNYSDLYLYNRK